GGPFGERGGADLPPANGPRALEEQPRPQLGRVVSRAGPGNVREVVDADLDVAVDGTTLRGRGRRRHQQGRERRQQPAAGATPHAPPTGPHGGARPRRSRGAVSPSPAG